MQWVPRKCSLLNMYVCIYLFYIYSLCIRILGIFSLLFVGKNFFFFNIIFLKLAILIFYFNFQYIFPFTRMQ